MIREDWSRPVLVKMQDGKALAPCRKGLELHQLSEGQSSPAYQNLTSFKNVFLENYKILKQTSMRKDVH